MTKHRTLIILFFIFFQNYSISGQDVYRFPDSPDNIDVESNKELIQAELTAENVEQYILMAQSLWNLGEDSDAKKMFLKIFHSPLPILSKERYTNSDHPDDTTNNIYDYGSIMEHSKHTAAIHLSQIYINERDFNEAFKYLVNADKNYPKTFAGGTGYLHHEDQLRYLYGLCYEGLSQYDNAIQLLLPHCFSWQNQTLIRVLKSKYNQAELKSIITESLNHIDFQLNEYESKITQTTNSGTNSESTKEISYTTGTGTIKLLGVWVHLHKPNLEHGETATKEHFIEEFKQTNFYVQLTGDYSHGVIRVSHR